MNRERHTIPHPAVIYIVLLLVAMTVSWIGSILQMRITERSSDIVLQNILNAQGIRWLVRSFPTAISDAPVGNALLLLSATGLLKASRICGSVRRALQRVSLSYKERVGLITALSVLAVFVCLILADLSLGHRVLSGITGTLSDSPIADGAMLVLFLVIALPSVIFGFASGVFRNSGSVMSGLTMFSTLTMSFLITLLIGSQLLAILTYSRLGMLIGLEGRTLSVTEFIVWWLPLPWLLAIEWSRPGK